MLKIDWKMSLKRRSHVSYEHFWRASKEKIFSYLLHMKFIYEEHHHTYVFPWKDFCFIVIDHLAHLQV